MPVTSLQPGQVGYIGRASLFSYSARRIPCIPRAIYLDPRKAGANPLRVYCNPDTCRLEVTVTGKVKATDRPAETIAKDRFAPVVMVLTAADGTNLKIDRRIPDSHWQPWAR